MAAATYDLQQGRSTQLGGIRVVVCDPDQHVRAGLRAVIRADSALVLTSEACNWQECEADLDRLVPELLIVRSGLLPFGWIAQARQDWVFPVVVTLRDAATNGLSARGYGELPLPIDTEITGALLNQAVIEIYNRKASELSDLLARYTEGLGQLRAYPSVIKVELEGRSTDLRIHSVLAIVAARKSVYIHSFDGRSMLRKPIHQVAAELDPSIFLRIHRSVMVNLQYVDGPASLKHRLSHVFLTDGSRYPVGLNYKDSIAHLLKPELS